MVDIIIPHIGLNADITAKAIRCLESIERNSREGEYQVILVDDGTSDEAWEPMAECLRQLNRRRTGSIALIRNRINQGFIKATNSGILFSTAPWVVLMNNDTEAVPDWLDKLRAPMDADGGIGMVGPLTTTPHSWQGRFRPGPTPWIVMKPGRMLAFFCVMIRRKALDQIGLMDEDFSKWAGFGGDDYECWRYEKAGWKLALAQNLRIPHHHRTTIGAVYGDDVKAMQIDALAAFRERSK